MKDSERKAVVTLLLGRYGYHDKIWRQELMMILEPGVGGIYSSAVSPAWNSSATEDAQRRVVNLIARMLREGIIQTTRERGKYRVTAWELKEAA